MLMDPNKRCPHGRLLWWNYGDGNARHYSSSGNTPMRDICREASTTKQQYVV